MTDEVMDSLQDVQDLILRYTGGNPDEDNNGSIKEVALRYMTAVVPKTSSGQVAAGAAGGWAAGYLAMKIGKAAAFSIGAGLLMMQLAHYQGYVKVDWKKLNKDLAGRGTEFIRRSKAPKLDQKSILDFINQNKNLTGGFIAGLFLGVSFS